MMLKQNFFITFHYIQKVSFKYFVSKVRRYTIKPTYYSYDSVQYLTFFDKNISLTKFFMLILNFFIYY